MKWMKLAGIFGIVFLIIGLVFFIMLSVQIFTMEEQTLISATNDSESSSIIDVLMIFCFFIGFVLLMLFYYGFVKLGGYTNSKLLKISSILLIITFITLALIFGILALVGSLSSNIFVPLIAENVIGMSPGGNLGGPDTSNLGKGILVISLIFVVICFILVLASLSAIGLVEAGYSVKYARMAGILNVIFLAVGPLFSLISYFSFLFATFLVMFGVSSLASIIVFVLFLIPFCFYELVLLLESLALFDASKKFEK